MRAWILYSFIHVVCVALSPGSLGYTIFEWLVIIEKPLHKANRIETWNLENRNTKKKKQLAKEEQKTSKEEKTYNERVEREKKVNPFTQEIEVNQRMHEFISQNHWNVLNSTKYIYI